MQFDRNVDGEWRKMLNGYGVGKSFGNSVGASDVSHKTAQTRRLDWIGLDWHELGWTRQEDLDLKGEANRVLDRC